MHIFVGKHNLTTLSSKKVENTWLRNDFARGEDVFSAAFRQVMRGISMDDCLQDKISQALYDSLNAGGREQEKKLYSVLKGKAWSWPDLANWQEHFQSAGEWPYMWRGDHLNPTSHEGILENVRHTSCYTSFLQRIQAKAR